MNLPLKNIDIEVKFVIVFSSLQGDEGGPFVCQLPGQENWKLFGIYSWSIQCGSVLDPNAFVRVTSYLNWIHNIIDQEE